MSTAVPQSYDSYRVGDHVYCLSWIGMPFTVAAKKDDSGTICLECAGPSSLPNAPKVDVTTADLFKLSHEKWDQIWYWPDRAGEQYEDVVRRFVARHTENEIVTAYLAHSLGHIISDAQYRTSHRVSFSGLDTWYQIYVRRVAAIADDGKGIIVIYDPSIAEERWLWAGPPMPLSIEMIGYRWALTDGRSVFNWYDFA